MTGSGSGACCSMNFPGFQGSPNKTNRFTALEVCFIAQDKREFVRALLYTMDSTHTFTAQLPSCTRFDQASVF